MLGRILEESTNNIDIAVTWVINAKNSRTNVHGFSPYQLAISQNPILSCAATSNPPALTHTQSAKFSKKTYVIPTRQDRHSLKVRILSRLKELSTTTSKHTATPVF